MDSRESKNEGIEDWISALRDRDGATREHAREHLVALGSQATSALVPLLAEDENRTRWEAAMALSEIADPASIPALLDALEDDDNDVCWVAAEGLVAMGPSVALPLLQNLIERGGSLKVRQGVHHVLRELRHSEIGDQIDGLYQALSNANADVGVTAEAERALKSLASGKR